MIIIIEGADLVGKTTLINGLVGNYPYPVIKLRWELLGDPEIETRSMAKATTAILDAVRPNVILDRSYFSWWAYAQPLGYDNSYMPELIGLYKPVADTRLILLTATAVEIEKRFRKTPDLYFSLDIIQSANNRFPSLLTLLPKELKSLHIDTTATSAIETIQQVESFLDER